MHSHMYVGRALSRIQFYSQLYAEEWIAFRSSMEVTTATRSKVLYYQYVAKPLFSCS